MSPCEAAVLTQIILKDLRPILYPHLENNSTVALKNYNTKAVRTLTKENAMWAWDWSNRMSKAYRARWDIDAAAKAFEDKEELGPQPGCQIAVCLQLYSQYPFILCSFEPLTHLYVLGRSRSLKKVAAANMLSRSFLNPPRFGQRPSTMENERKFMSESFPEESLTSLYSVRAKESRLGTAMRFTPLY